MSKKTLTGYPSIDKPWLKYYMPDEINAELPKCTVYEYLWENNRDHLNDIALIYFDNKIKYQEMFARISETAQAFSNIGVKSSDVVTLVTLNCPKSVFCFYALNLIGAVVNFINVLASEEELKKYFSDSKVVIVENLFAEKVIRAAEGKTIEKIITYSFCDDMPFIKKRAFQFAMRQLDKAIEKIESKKVIRWDAFVSHQSEHAVLRTYKSPEAPCALAHTGGTTGFPKSVLISDQSMNAIILQYAMHFKKFRRQQVFLSTIVPFVIYGLLVNIHMPLCLGFQTVLIPKFEDTKWKTYFKKYRPEHISAIPSYYSKLPTMKDLANLDLSRLITFGCGGDGMNVSLEEKLNEFLQQHGSSAKVLNGYGMTELCATAVLEFENAYRSGSVGIPLVKNSCMIWDVDNNCECPYNTTGEICLTGPAKMLGYREKECEKEIIQIHKDNEEWFHTGDLGYMDEDGFLFIVGRMKRFCFVGKEGLAYKVYPSIIEDCIAKIYGVSMACVVSTHIKNDWVLKAFVVKDDEQLDSFLLETAIREQCSKELPDNQRPSIYEFCKELPLTPIGKIDYRALERLA